jgi:hypothetical protein
MFIKWTAHNLLGSKCINFLQNLGAFFLLLVEKLPDHELYFFDDHDLSSLCIIMFGSLVLILSCQIDLIWMWLEMTTNSYELLVIMVGCTFYLLQKCYICMMCCIGHSRFSVQTRVAWCWYDFTCELCFLMIYVFCHFTLSQFVSLCLIVQYIWWSLQNINCVSFYLFY